MDPLAHSLVGAALAATGRVRAVPLARVTLVVAANLPDLDVLSLLGGSDLGLACRRGFTHGILALVLLPLVWAACLRLWNGRAGPARAPVAFRTLWLLASIGVTSHVLLDWLNTYGVRLLMPFDRRWFYGDAVFIVDPWLWLVLGAAVFVARPPTRGRVLAWSALAAAATAALVAAGPLVPRGVRLAWLAALACVVLGCALRPPDARARPRIVAAALTACAVYVGLMIVAAQLARPLVRAELARRGAGPVQALMVAPRPADPFTRDVVAATPAGYRFGRFDWLPRPRLTLEAGIVPTPPPSGVVAAALAAPGVRGMRAWARFPFYEVEHRPEGDAVWILDARYTRRRTTGFGGTLVRGGR